MGRWGRVANLPQEFLLLHSGQPSSSRRPGLPCTPAGEEILVVRPIVPGPSGAPVTEPGCCLRTAKRRAGYSREPQSIDRRLSPQGRGEIRTTSGCQHPVYVPTSSGHLSFSLAAQSLTLLPASRELPTRCLSGKAEPTSLCGNRMPGSRFSGFSCKREADGRPATPHQVHTS